MRGLVLLLCLGMATPAFAQRVRVNGGSSPSFGEVTASCLETGQGCNELYDMDQNVQTTNTPTFLGAVFGSNILVNKDGIGATTTNGSALINNTAAAAGAQQWCPRLLLQGNGWKTDATAASMLVNWRIECVPVQGAAAPTSNLIFVSNINGSDTGTITYTSSGSIVSTNTLQGLLLNATASYFLNTVELFQGGTPAVSSCGDAALATGSRDSIGRVVGTTQTGCTLTFSAALGTNSADCIIQNITSEGQGVATATTTAMTVTLLAAGDDFMYICGGR